jgi:serine protease Do
VAEHSDQKAGDFVTVVGHSFGMKFTFSEGRILNAKIREDGLDYILHDSVLQTGNKGGVLLNESGEVIGMNTFQYPSPEKGSFSLPVHYLIDILEAFQKGKGLAGVRCQGCHQLVFENTARQGSCPFCGSKIILPPEEEEYEAIGIARTIEEILKKSGHNVRLARRGPNFWEIRQGSALICITYYEPNGLIAGDAVLCNLPKEKSKSVFEFLLRQNFQMEGLTFSIKGQEIMLSLIIFDRYLNTGTGLKLFKYLFDKADYFDNILVEKFGAVWREGNL